ncbi:UMP-CMP kinase 2, mitochondrial [Pseudolycoriella hygida]|uniref:UMP-CMP kinase 2, mitochondrial n=1 Tax=Pseudolycoriella hygida TaxID=35572 RepID=A0A9Q0MNV0_9DIPT|nr:UMP-CMP kinase 2, mitochondrial [Pseudolycoriella hygida]
MLFVNYDIRSEIKVLRLSLEVSWLIRKTMSSSIFYSLESALATLVQVQRYPEVQKLLNICKETGILKEFNGRYLHVETSDKCKTESAPFIVIEGLDGTGKTTITDKIQQKYRMRAMQTPPAEISDFRDFFDGQSESVKRAYYSLGNYLAVNNVLKCAEPVIMVRFWHSTAAYALGYTTDEEKLKNVNLDWPHDLLQPNLVLLLFVSEEERVRRHATRLLRTNTPEEQSLAKNQIFRDRIIDVYRRIKGPRFCEINADASMEEIENRIFEMLELNFPALRS